ncbi:MAG: tetratricopeptide repeat protein [Calditrichia bacterium]
MSDKLIHMTSLSIRKWDLEHYRLYLDTWQVALGEEHALSLEIGIAKPSDMLKDFLNTIQQSAKELFSTNGKASKIKIENEALVKSRLLAWFKRINSELNNPKRKKDQPKMIFTTYQDVYPEGEDIKSLDKKTQSHVMLSWARKYYEKGDYKKAIDPLRRLIKAVPDFGLAHKWLARSLKKVRKYDEAMRQYEKYVEVENSLDAWLDLAKSYRKGKVFDKSEEIYQKILKDNPQEKEALIGLAQIHYAQKDDRYSVILDDLGKVDLDWLQDWLRDEFNFRIYLSEKTPLSPIQAAKFLGYTRVFDLTEKAFKNDVPSHFNPARARVSFYREELENWAAVMNRFSCLDEPIKLYPEKINRDDPNLEMPDSNTISRITQPLAQETEAPVTKVEDILAHIRARKAERLAMQESNEPLMEPADGQSSQPQLVHDSTAPPKRARKSPAKKRVANS